MRKIQSLFLFTKVKYNKTNLALKYRRHCRYAFRILLDTVEAIPMNNVRDIFVEQRKFNKLGKTVRKGDDVKVGLHTLAVLYVTLRVLEKNKQQG